MLGIESARRMAASARPTARPSAAPAAMPARSVEDCYALNSKADRAAVFAGWREMNDYMRENKIEAVRRP